MTGKRTYHRFAHKGANFRICCDRVDRVRREIVRQRALLEAYLRRHPEFGASLVPVAARPDAPVAACRMAAAAAAAGVGPMAAVAGTMAQLAAEAALAEGCGEAIVENGGDLYAACRRPLIIGLYAGEGPLSDRLALVVRPGQTPLAVCSSSGTMGHSFSMGACDLATVVSYDAALADAAATRAANLVRSAADIDAALSAVCAIEGVAGALLVKGDRVGLMGTLPELARNRDGDLSLKVTREGSHTRS